MRKQTFSRSPERSLVSTWAPRGIHSCLWLDGESLSISELVFFPFLLTDFIFLSSLKFTENRTDSSRVSIFPLSSSLTDVPIINIFH